MIHYHTTKWVCNGHWMTGKNKGRECASAKRDADSSALRRLHVWPDCGVLLLSQGVLSGSSECCEAGKAGGSSNGQLQHIVNSSDRTAADRLRTTFLSDVTRPTSQRFQGCRCVGARCSARRKSDRRCCGLSVPELRDLWQWAVAGGLFLPTWRRPQSFPLLTQENEGGMHYFTRDF